MLTQIWEQQNGLSARQVPGCEDGSISGDELLQSFSAKTDLSVHCQVYASNQEEPLTLQQFGAPGSVGNKPELKS